VKTVPAGLSVFRIGDDGKLTFARKYDVDVGDKTMFWMGMVPPVGDSSRLRFDNACFFAPAKNLGDRPVALYEHRASKSAR